MIPVRAVLPRSVFFLFESLVRDVHFRVTARRGRVYHGCNPLDVEPHNRPLGCAQHHKGYSATCKVLLKAHVLVCGKQHIETRLFRFSQQVAVGERVPPSVFRLGDGVTLKKRGNAARRDVVKENEH